MTTLIAEITKQIGVRYSVRDTLNVSDFEIKQAIIRNSQTSFGLIFNISDDYSIDYNVEEYIDRDSLKSLLKKGDEGLADILITCLMNKLEVPFSEVDLSVKRL